MGKTAIRYHKSSRKRSVHHRRQIAMRGRDDANVDANRLSTANPFDERVLQYAQEADLGIVRKFADFIEKERASVGSLEPALSVFRKPPVKLLSWPNNCESTSSGGMAPQFTRMKGPSRRSLRVWIARATTSLPVPVSPSSRTGASELLTKSTLHDGARAPDARRRCGR